MRILVFVERFMFPTQTFIYNEINKLAIDHEVKLVTTEHTNAEKYPFHEVIEIPMEVPAIPRRIFWELEKRDILINRRSRKFAAALRELMNEFKPDIIHGHFGYETLTLLENLDPTNIPIFITFHGYDASQMLSRRKYIASINKYIRKFNITVFCVAGYMKAALLDAGMHVDNAVVNFCGVDCTLFSAPSGLKTNSGKTFLQISSFGEKKGHVYTLHAFSKFLTRQSDKSKFRLVLAGAWDHFEEIKNLCHSLGLSDHVFFPGAVNPEQARALLEEADFFVHHSITSKEGDMEGIPNAIIEAMAMELPVLSTWHSGIPELVEDGVNGYLVKEKDVDGYAARMEDILSWKKSPVNREKVLTHFSIDVHMKRLMNVYQETLKKADKSLYSKKN